jgi:hypothetical protein
MTAYLIGIVLNMLNTRWNTCNLRGYLYCKLALVLLLCCKGNDGMAQFPNQSPITPSLGDMQQQSRQQIDQQNRQLMQQFGHTPPPTQQDILAQQQRWLNGKPPELTRMEQVQKEVLELLQDALHQEDKTAQTDYYHSPEYLQDAPHYTHALKAIADMLAGKRALSIKDAYYKAEAAYGNLHLDYSQYTNLIQSNADFILKWLVANKYPTKDAEALHYGIQKFMSDTLYITVQGKRVGHMPYFYDYIDVNAQQDRRNYFVTKTLATGTGQCHTFPITYLILAEALGVEAALAYNTRHSFIRYKNNQGMVINYETTVDRFLADAFYLQTLPVMAAAQKNNLYIKSLSKKQVIASVLFDLAADFIKEHWVADNQLIKECLAIAAPHFPDQDYINVTESYLRKRLYANEVNKMVMEKGITNMSQMQQYPDLMLAYESYFNYVETISRMGIQEFPIEEELRFMEYADKKGRLMQARGINSKQPRTLFIH